MNDDRRLRIIAELTAGLDDESVPARLCDVCMDVTGMSGAGIMLMSEEVPLGSYCTTGDTSALIEDLQYTLGEGPCVDAYRLDRPVLEPDLADPVTPRWLAFAEPAVEAGVRAVFGFPMGVGATRLGALNLYADEPGPLSSQQLTDAVMMAQVAAETVLEAHAAGPRGPMGLGAERSEFRYVVHQAAGMVSAQLDVSVAQALLRLRARAFAEGCPLAELASDVVDRKIRFADLDG